MRFVIAFEIGARHEFSNSCLAPISSHSSRPFADVPEQLRNWDRLYQNRPTAGRRTSRRDLGLRAARQRRGDARLSRPRPHGGQDAQPIAIGQSQVEQHHVDGARVGDGYGVAYRVGDGYVVTRFLEQHAQRTGDVGAVIDDQDVRSRLHRSARVADGKREIKSATLTELALEPDPASVELDEAACDR